MNNASVDELIRIKGQLEEKVAGLKEDNKNLERQINDMHACKVDRTVTLRRYRTSAGITSDVSFAPARCFLGEEDRAEYAQWGAYWVEFWAIDFVDKTVDLAARHELTLRSDGRDS